MSVCDHSGFRTHIAEYELIRREALATLTQFGEVKDLYSIIMDVIAKTDGSFITDITSDHLEAVKKSMNDNLFRLLVERQDLVVFGQWVNALTPESFLDPDHWATLPVGLKSNRETIRKYVYMYPFVMILYRTLTNHLSALRSGQRKANMVDKRYSKEVVVSKRNDVDETLQKQLWATTNT